MEIRSITPWSLMLDDAGVYVVNYIDDEGVLKLMNVFAPNEVVAIVKAHEAYQTNQEVIALQKLTRRIK
jgi:hypothetical protein